jgi:hypothetical protein
LALPSSDGDDRSPKARSNSAYEVTSVGITGSDVSSGSTYGSGPYRASPAMPNVLVGTPSIDLDRKLVSST